MFFFVQVASVAYRYRKWNLGNDIVLICRCELDAVQQVPHHTIPRVVDPPWFNADPGPAFFLIADPDTDTDPVPNPRFWWPKIGKKIAAVKLIFYGSKISVYLSLGLHEGRTSYRRSLQPSKENIQHFKTWMFFIIFYICVSHLPSWIRIRIQQLKLMRIHAYPDPQPWPYHSKPTRTIPDCTTLLNTELRICISVIRTRIRIPRFT